MFDDVAVISFRACRRPHNIHLALLSRVVPFTFWPLNDRDPWIRSSFSLLDIGLAVVSNIRGHMIVWSHWMVIGLTKRIF